MSPATVTFMMKELVENDAQHPDLTQVFFSSFSVFFVTFKYPYALSIPDVKKKTTTFWKSNLSKLDLTKLDALHSKEPIMHIKARRRKYYFPVNEIVLGPGLVYSAFSKPRWLCIHDAGEVNYFLTNFLSMISDYKYISLCLFIIFDGK